VREFNEQGPAEDFHLLAALPEASLHEDVNRIRAEAEQEAERTVAAARLEADWMQREAETSRGPA
jgi:vacuolar-type H+-ATPase subunit E/Vma4